MAELADTVAAVRRFNRFYTRAIGVLDRAYQGFDYTVTESRVLFEIATAGGITPKAIREALGLDAGYLSRIVARFERDGLVARKRSDTDGRSIVLSLTEAGRDHFAGLNARSADRAQALVDGLSADERGRLAGALGEAEALLAPGRGKAPVVLRPHQVGDMGWVIERHAVLYQREYGWTGMEALVARITAEFLERFDPAKEACWIAEREGERLGCVFVVNDEGVARLRLLLLEPTARGERLGRRLVDECVAFARAAGYREMVLWTHRVLTAARAIYAAVGFELEAVWTHDDFGNEEVSETWRLKL
jgi:DNA-binding MarR family transcriptional regulator/N-acetylglutamate synthase-like GNAT family acetyltransferase